MSRSKAAAKKKLATKTLLVVTSHHSTKLNDSVFKVTANIPIASAVPDPRLFGATLFGSLLSTVGYSSKSISLTTKNVNPRMQGCNICIEIVLAKIKMCRNRRIWRAASYSTYSNSGSSLGTSRAHS